MRSTDFCDEALLQADITCLGNATDNERDPQDTKAKECAPSVAKDAAAVRPSEMVEISSQEGEIVPQDCSYGTPCYALKRLGMMKPWWALATVYGRPKDILGSSPLTEDLGEENPLPVSNWHYDGPETVEELLASTCDESGEDPTSPPESCVSEPPDSLSKVFDWQPQCPHCGKSNEYGQAMCDPVLPRICEDEAE